MAIDQATQLSHEGSIALEEVPQGDADSRRWEQSGRSRSGQAVAYRKSSCGCPVLAVRLIEDVRKVINHGFLADNQFLRYLAIALAAGNQLEHRSLALGQGWLEEEVDASGHQGDEKEIAVDGGRSGPNPSSPTP